MKVLSMIGFIRLPRLCYVSGHQNGNGQCDFSDEAGHTKTMYQTISLGTNLTLEQ